MNLFQIPRWIEPHLYSNKRFSDFTPDQIEALRQKLKPFNRPDPEISIVIPAWNEENNIYRALSSLADNRPRLPAEIVVVNNNSTDNTQQVLDTLGVKSCVQTIQGTQHARQMGLENTKGKYYLCADSDTIYPPDWINCMIEPLVTDKRISCVYGNYSFLPPEGQNRLGLALYELAGEVVIRLRRRQGKEFVNAYGFNMGFETRKGLQSGGFIISGSRRYDNIKGSDFVNESEDGRMALNLMSFGRLHRVTSKKATVFTSSRRLMDDGSIWKAFLNRLRRQMTEKTK